MSKRIPNLIERIGLALAGGYLREAGGDSIDPDDDLYRRVTSDRRSLNPIAQERAQKIALHLWRHNPLGHRLTEMIVDYVVGDGINIEAADERVQAIADEFWTDPVMALDLRHRDLVRDQSLYGELALRTYVNPISGRMRVGYIDVNRIKDVLLDTENAMVDRTLVLANANFEMGVESVPIVNWDDITDPTRPRWVGDAFYFGINRVTGQGRGTPDLLAIADFMDGYDQLLFNQLERTGFINAFVWDVTLHGADDTQIADWLVKNAAPPRPGTQRVHNEKETWNVVSPDLGNDASATIGRAVKNVVLGGAGVPEAWFADGDAANRATLAEQGDPTFRMLQTRQRTVKAMFERILAVVVERAIEAGRLPSTLDPTERAITVNLPDPSAKDTGKISAAIVQLANGLMAATGEEWISKASARKVFLSITGQLGVELDPTAEEQAIEAERASVVPDPAEQARNDAIDALLSRTDAGNAPSDAQASQVTPDAPARAGGRQRPS